MEDEEPFDVEDAVGLGEGKDARAAEGEADSDPCEEVDTAETFKNRGLDGGDLCFVV